MKKSILIFVSLMLIFPSCKVKSDQSITISPKYPHEYKYKIEGLVQTPEGFHKATFYTDTFVMVNGGRELRYQNSDSSIQKIYSPYKIEHIK